MSRKVAVIDQTRCVACGECEYVCPRAAVAIEQGKYAKVDSGKCIGCGVCANNCPAGCIEVEERQDEEKMV